MAHPVSPSPPMAAAGRAHRLVLALLALLVAVPAQAEDRALPVPTTTIYAGDLIKPAMLREQLYPETFQPRAPVIGTMAEAVGRVARRTLLPGETVPANALDDARLVTRGAPTLIVFEEMGLAISTMGVALTNGGLNEAIRVRNSATGRIVQGVVQADGHVRTGTP